MKHEKVLRVFSSKKVLEIKFKHNAGSKVMLSFQIRCCMKRKLQPNPVSAEMDVYSKTGCISLKQILSIINDLHKHLMIRETEYEKV